jgi:membrane protein
MFRNCHRIAYEAFREFDAADGWAIASHIALMALMSLFPFLIIVTALAGVVGSEWLADEAARFLLETWPPQVSQPIAREIHTVLTGAHGGLLTVSIVIAIYFATLGVDSLRVGLNRSYDVADTRPWWLLRLESIAYVMVAAIALLVFTLLVVLAPLLWAAILRFLPDLAPLGGVIAVVRYTIAAIVLSAALTLVHLWLPAGHRTLRDIAPGVIATLALWLIAGWIFGRYLEQFAANYATFYASLASVMIALVFLYLVSSIFIYGGELNAAIQRARKPAIKA